MDIPISEKFVLSVSEAAAYFRIGEGKLRRIIQNNKSAKYILWNGNRPQIKRALFESFIENLSHV